MASGFESAYKPTEDELAIAKRFGGQLPERMNAGEEYPLILGYPLRDGRLFDVAIQAFPARFFNFTLLDADGTPVKRIETASGCLSEYLLPLADWANGMDVAEQIAEMVASEFLVFTDL